MFHDYLPRDKYVCALRTESVECDFSMSAAIASLSLTAFNGCIKDSYSEVKMFSNLELDCGVFL